MGRVLANLALGSAAFFGIALVALPAQAEIGGEAPLFDTWDENEQLVSMADMIDGRPLVLAIGSAS
jgi:hypothetical protein